MDILIHNIVNKKIYQLFFFDSDTLESPISKLPRPISIFDLIVN
jgi:hypothetical protein